MYNPSLPRLLNNLALSLSNQNKLDRALEILAWSLEIGNKQSNFHILGNSYLYLGIVYEKGSEFALARRAYEKTLELFGLLFGPEDPRLAEISQNIGSLNLKMKDTKNARLQLTHAIELWTKRFGKDSAETVYSKGVMAMVDLNEKRIAAATGWFRNICRICTLKECENRVWIELIKELSKQALAMMREVPECKDIMTPFIRGQ